MRVFRALVRRLAGGEVRPPTLALWIFAVLFALGATMLAAADARSPTGSSGGGSKSGGGGGASVPQSNPGFAIPAPTSTVLSDFRSFYVVVDGGEPLFQTYATERIASAMSDAFLGNSNPSPSPSGEAPVVPPPYYFVAAAGWNEDTLNGACKNDPNAIGGLVVKYSGFFTQGNWLIFTTEREHIQPHFIFVSCANGVASHVSPAIAVLTERSRAQFTIPIAPVTALTALFTLKSSSPSPTTVYGIGYGALLLTTAIGGLSGDIGRIDPGHEALEVSERVARDAVQLTQTVCSVPSPNPAYVLALREDYQTLWSVPGRAFLAALLPGETANWKTANPPAIDDGTRSPFSIKAWEEPAPSPSPKPLVEPLHFVCDSIVTPTPTKPPDPK